MATQAPPSAPPVAFRVEVLWQRWAALHQAAGLVAGLAGHAARGAALAAEPCPDPVGLTRGWRQALIAQHLADTAAILESGIRALLDARARGAPIEPAAEALWEEFLMARTAIIALARPT